MIAEKVYTKAEWFAEGERRFGKNPNEWKYKCPSCGAVRCSLDFRPFKEKGATPNSVYQECLGRYTGGRNGPDKCDWAAYGLFRGPHFVETEGERVAVFEFADTIQVSDDL